MSGGAHHNPHGRQGQPNSAWNHLQVPNYFPRQPQLAHMSSDRPLSLSPLTWHTPTTSEPPTKSAPGPLYNLQQMILSEPRPIQQNPLDNITLTTRERLEGLGISLNRQTSLDAIQSFSRHITLPGVGVGSVDLTLSRSAPSPHSLSCSPSMIRNGQNGEASAPISLSVRDTKQINSMDTAELNKLQTGRSLDIVSTSPSISQRSNSPKSPKPFKRMGKKMDTVLERLNSAPAELCSTSRQSPGILILPVQEDNSIQQVSQDQRLPSPASLSQVSIAPSMTAVDIQHVPLAPVTEESTEVVDKLRHKRKPDKTTRIEKEGKEPDLSAENSIAVADTAITTVGIPELLHVPGLVQAPNPPQEIESVSNSIQELSSGTQSNAIQAPSTLQESVVAQDSEPTPEPEPEQSNPSRPVLTNTCLATDTSLEPLKLAFKPSETTDSAHATESNAESLVNSNQSYNTVPVVTAAPAQMIKRRSSNEESHVIPCKIRRKTCSESETIDNIAAMIASGDDVSVIVPKAISCENNAIKDSQTLAHVLAGPLNEEDLDLPSSNNEAKTVIHNNKEDNAKAILVSEDIQILKTTNKSEETSVDKPSDLLEKVENLVNNENTNSTNFVQVENELEKMFAGIDETSTTEAHISSEGSQNIRDNVTSTSNESKPKRKSSNSLVRINRKSSDSAENTPKKKNPAESVNKKPQLPSRSKNAKIKNKSQNSQKNIKLKSKLDPAMKDILTYDSGSNASSNKSRGPFIQIKGPRDSPISVSIVNTSTNDEDPENRMKHPKTKKHHDDAEFRHKMRKGLHSSTLSMKYDAMTTDVTWVCVFCKSGPHCGGTNLGDLFGPYLVTTSCVEFQYSQQNPEDDPFKSKRTKLDMISKNALNSNTTKQPVKRKRSSHSENSTSVADLDIYAGMVEASPGAYEVWGHEECIIWAPGVYLVGSRVIGLEGAVWSSCRAKCSLCNLTGANVGCSQRGCDKYAHISCAARNDWYVLEEVYKATCPDHHST